MIIERRRQKAEFLAVKALLKKIRQFPKDFCDDRKYIKFKLAVILILIIIGMSLDSWRW